MFTNILALRPKGSDWLFSVKTFAASVLALFIALTFDLDRPVWAMATVYVVAHPLSGVLASKALYRVIGTIFGAVAAIVLVPNLVDAPVLLSLSLALWVGGCLYLSRLDRTPKSYLFMLAGYTAAIVGFPCVTDPGTIFDTAIARVQEISLGIICATVVSHVVFPRHVGPVIAARIDGWMADVAKLATLSFDVNSEADKLYRDRARIAADIGELHGLAVHLGYEKSRFSGRTRQLQALQSAIAALLPVLYAVHDRITALTEYCGQIPDALQVILDDVVAHLAMEQHDGARARALHLRITTYGEAFANPSDWAGLLQLNLCNRLHRLLNFHADCCLIWDGLRAGSVPAEVVDRWRDSARDQALHRDHGVAFRSGLTAVIATLLVCGFWILTAWPSGATAAMMAAVGGCIMSFLDNPVPALKGFIRYTAMAIVVVVIYSLAILPGIDGFALLVMAFAPYFLLLGVLMTSPQTYGFGLVMLVNVVMILNVDTAYSSDFATLLDSGIASLAGLAVAALVTAFVRSVTVDDSIRRLVIANWRDISAIARGTLKLPRMVMIRRLLDRQGLILPRLALAPDYRDTLMRAMPEVSIAASLHDLHRFKVLADRRIATKIDVVLRNIARHFDSRRRDFLAIPDPMILDEIDNILREVVADASSPGRDKLLIPLIALRRTLSKKGAPILDHPAEKAFVADLPPLMGETA
ncbi:FUSC family protein [Thalassospira alkalitolerans]|uniref:FUSC family protein n=1 Tax=Thalassospira alkalitolerans TaxID=1293890 RepID=UPI003AA98FCE